MTLAFSCGDPSGIGPRVAVLAALERASSGVPVLLFGDAKDLHRRLAEEPASDGARALVQVVDAGAVPPERVALHAPDAVCGAAQVRALDLAVHAVRAGRAHALVTAPTSKAAAVMAGIPFTGQTEHLARGAGLSDDDVTMLFLGPRLRVALVTTHLSVRAVPDAITAPRVERAMRHLADALVRLGRPHGAWVALAGLNPHAGEGGLFGDEEPRVLAPALARVVADPTFASGRLRAAGIVPAETAFRRAAEGSLDGVVAMMHDQATIASKLLDWGQAANVTWGLPFVRTSVDHGVAYDAAARGLGDPEGMIAAARMACALVPEAVGP